MTSRTAGRAAVVERLVTCDIGGRAAIEPIRQAVAEVQQPPAPLRAAERLAANVDTGDDVVILTGFLIPPSMAPETDGPPGAVSLARALDDGLGANPIIACEPAAVEVCEATARAGGLAVQDRSMARESARTAAVEPFPVDADDADGYAETLLALDPAAVVAVEKVGPNREGVYHNMAGYDISEHSSKVDRLYDRLGEDVPTIAIGDAGNEVGMGVVEEAVRRHVERGADCQCDCEAGIASALGSDVLVPAAVSNWGAHAVVTCLGLLVERSLLHRPAVERRMLEAGSSAGAIDGIAGGTTAWCDGLPTAVHESMVGLLREIPRRSVHDRGGGELAR